GAMRQVASGARVVHTACRPFPLGRVSGRRIVYATTAPATAMPGMVDHLQQEHGAMVVATSPHLGQREQLKRDLDAARHADTLLVELKAAAVDVAVRAALERGMEVVFCDNRVVTREGDDFDEVADWLRSRVTERFER